MKINTYNNFKKPVALFLGLSFKSLFKVSVILLSFIFLISKLKLSLNHPLCLIYALVSMVFVVLIIKSEQEYKVKNRYSSILFHPFQNQYLAVGYKHANLTKLDSINSIHDQYAITTERDLLSVVKLHNGINLNNVDKQEAEQIINTWQNFLAQFNQIDNLGSYFSEPNYDSLQLFIKVDELKSRLKQITQSKFIPELSFYIIIKLKNPINQKATWLKLFDKFKQNNNYDLNELKEKLQIKTQALQDCLTSLEISSNKLETEELTKFLAQDSSYKKFIDSKGIQQIQDQGHYLQIKYHNQNLYSKTFRLTQMPESNELNFWLVNCFKKIQSNAYITMHIESRNPHRDKNILEHRSEILSQFNKSKSSQNYLISENNQLIKELNNNESCFDLSLFITIFSDEVHKLQSLNNPIKHPYSNSVFNELPREQVNNWLYSLPHANNKLTNQEKLFSNIHFCAACFPFVKSKLGTQEGPLLGTALEDNRPVYLNEFDRGVFHNRGINFIGDSGSGKSLAAKLAVKRRIEQGQECFFVIDNTLVGWDPLVQHFNGTIIKLDKQKLKPSYSVFTPLQINSNDDINEHLENMLLFFDVLSGDYSLQIEDKAFLVNSLKKIYQNNPKPNLSELYLSWSRHDDAKLASKWQSLISPYTNITQGSLAYLADGMHATVNSNRFTLFAFGKIQNDKQFLATSLFLVSNYIEQKIIKQELSKPTLIVDEAWKLFSAKSSDYGQALIEYLARAGRGLDFGLWTISQKPSDLPRSIHSSASASLCFQLKDTQDQNNLARLNNLKTSETTLINHPSMSEAGTCLLKTTRSSDLIYISCSQKELELCSS